MKKILSLMLCLIMVIACASLIACNNDKGDKKLTFERARRNLESHEYTIEIATEDYCNDVQESALDDYGIEITVKNALMARKANTYEYVYIAELASAAEARSMADAISEDSDHETVTTKGSLIIMASSETALSHALEGKKSSTDGGFGGFGNSDTNSSSGNSGISSLTISQITSNYQSNGYQVETFDRITLSDFESEFYGDYGINVTLNSGITAYNSYTYNYAIAFELASTSQAQGLYNAVENDPDISSMKCEVYGKLFIIASSNETLEHAFERGSVSTNTNPSTNTDNNTHPGHDHNTNTGSSDSIYGDIETGYLSIDTFASNLSYYGITLEQYDDSEESNLYYDFVRQYATVDIYEAAEASYYGDTILIIEFYGHNDAVSFHDAIYEDYHNGYGYYLAVRGDSILIASDYSLIEYACRA